LGLPINIHQLSHKATLLAIMKHVNVQKLTKHVILVVKTPHYIVVIN